MPDEKLDLTLDVFQHGRWRQERPGLPPLPLLVELFSVQVQDLLQRRHFAHRVFDRLYQLRADHCERRQRYPQVHA